MKNTIHELIGSVLLVGVLFAACQSTLRKLTSLSKYVAKMYATVKTAATRQHETSAIHIQRMARSRKRDAAWHLVVSFVIIALLFWNVIKPGQPTRMDVLNISLGVCAASFVFFSYLAGRILNMVEFVMDCMIELAQKSDDHAA